MDSHSEPGKAAACRKNRPSRIGIVVSTGGQKTAVVAVERRVSHPVYRKFVRKTTKYIVHDERDRAGIGDRVRIVETRPISRRKRWRIAEILEKGAVSGPAAELPGGAEKP